MMVTSCSAPASHCPPGLHWLQEMLLHQQLFKGRAWWANIEFGAASLKNLFFLSVRKAENSLL